MRKPSTRRHDPRDIIAEALRRSTTPDGKPRYVIRLSEPPTAQEQLLLISARLERRPVIIVPAKCDSIDEWRARYRPLSSP